MSWCKLYKSSWSWVYTLTVVALLGLFGFSPNTSEPAEREETFGSIDCPEKLSLRWNELLSRPPYVERESNSTEVFGLFPGKMCFIICVVFTSSWTVRVWKKKHCGHCVCFEAIEPLAVISRKLCLFFL